jgi:putative toxin-antitoxin system antitoxin component (TIGR02293 family)
MKQEIRKRRTFDPKESISRAKATESSSQEWRLESGGHTYRWTTKLERVRIIRTGVPYASLEVIGHRINVPTKEVLTIFGLPQTTYNKKRRENSLLNGRDSEIVLLLTELFDFGLEVFNNEEDKFQRWMKKPNLSLGGDTPESLLDSITGMQEVKNSLNRLEFGNLA